MGVRRNDVLMVGMNFWADQEAKALRRTGAKVELIKDARKDDTIQVGRGRGAVTHDLTSPAGRHDFVATLDLPADQSKQIEEVLEHASDDSRDELAQLAQAWAPGEKGGEVPGRLVLSGHSGGSGLYGDEPKQKFKNGTLFNYSLTALAKAMPTAAGQVEDLAISACYCGGQRSLDAWKAGFPNVKTVLAYAEKSPGGDSAFGSRAHLARWEKFTRGDVDSLKPEAFKGLEKDVNVATWSARNGYLTPARKEDLAQVKQRVEDFQPTYQQYFSGEKAVSSERELRAHYDDLQDLRNRPETTDAERGELDRRIETTFRLMKYAHARVGFQRSHGAAVKAGYRALGLTPVPDFSRLSRKEALERVATFEQAVAAGPQPAPAAAAEALRLLTDGLRDLKDDAIIPRQGL